MAATRSARAFFVEERTRQFVEQGWPRGHGFVTRVRKDAQPACRQAAVQRDGVTTYSQEHKSAARTQAVAGALGAPSQSASPNGDDLALVPNYPGEGQDGVPKYSKFEPTV